MDTYGIRRQAMDTKVLEYPVSVYQKYQVSGIRILKFPSIRRQAKYTDTWQYLRDGIGVFQGFSGLSRVIQGYPSEGYPGLSSVI